MDEKSTNPRGFLSKVMSATKAKVLVAYYSVWLGLDGYFLWKVNAGLNTLCSHQTEHPLGMIVETANSPSAPSSPHHSCSLWEATNTDRLTDRRPYKAGGKLGQLMNVNECWLQQTISQFLWHWPITDDGSIQGGEVGHALWLYLLLGCLIMLLTHQQIVISLLWRHNSPPPLAI